VYDFIINKIKADFSASCSLAKLQVVIAGFVAYQYIVWP